MLLKMSDAEKSAPMGTMFLSHLSHDICTLYTPSRRRVDRSMIRVPMVANVRCHVVRKMGLQTELQVVSVLAKACMLCEANIQGKVEVVFGLCGRRARQRLVSGQCKYCLPRLPCCRGSVQPRNGRLGARIS